MTIEPTSVRFGGIQVLRALAAIAVVFCHSVAAAQGVSPDYAPWAIYGAQGVDLFFILSGFIIYYTVESGNLTAGAFARRRLERLVPVYWIFSVLVFAVGLTFAGSYASGISREWMSLENLAASLAFVSVPAGSQTIVFVGWTLEYEMLFYLCTAALIALSKRRWEALALLFSGAVIAGRLIDPQSAALEFLTNPLLLEFVMGVAVGEWLIKGRTSPWLVLPLLAALLACLLSIGEIWRIYLAGIPSALLLAVVAKADLARRAVPSRLKRGLMLLGDASYSIYLVQVLSVAVAFKAVLAISPAFPLPLLIGLAVLATIAAGVLMFLLLEHPLMKRFQARRRTATA